MEILGREWRRGEVLLADGAWGTEMACRGLMQGHPPDGWNLDHPEVVREISVEYRDAGSSIVLTNTFGSNRFLLEHHGLADRVRDINRAGARIAREALGGRALVGGDIGPTAKLLPLGEVTVEALVEAFAEQALALAEGGADWIVVESMSDVEEMSAAVRAAREATGLPVVACMTYQRTPKGYRTLMGNSPEDCVRAAEASGASIVGANCGSGIADYVPLAPILRGLTDLPLWIKANAGVPRLEGGKVVFPLTAEQYASFVPDLVRAGVDVIGGCCGTNPHFIREVAKTLAALRGA